MATLVLTTIGSVIGGPVGGAIGAAIGQQIDQRLFAPKRQGPRLGELAVQTSNYGQAIPRLFGRMRVAGTVIWATDLREDRHRSGGGKGRPKMTTYSYSASFAVALSARPIRAVHRIWADGKLLRGAAGDWKSETGFRLHPGGEGQAPDPLIASAEGIGQTPAHRGIAYAVFEDFQLADYGNHIPSLTFEVEADAGPVSVAGIADALSAGAVGGTTAAVLDGFAASGDSVRGAIETMAHAIPVAVRDDGTRLLLEDVPPAPIAIAVAETGARADGKRIDRIVIDRTAAGGLPDEVAVAYYEPGRDYQAGLQRARRGGPGRRVERIELPAALAAGAAKAVAEHRLADAWAARASGTISLPWRRAALRPGQMVQVDGMVPPMRISRWTLDRMALELKLAGVAAAGVGAVAAPGGGVLEPDFPHGPTRLALLDLPPLDSIAATSPHIWIAAAGPSPAWRRAALSYSMDDGTSWQDVGPTAAPAVMGVAETALSPGSAVLIDRDAVVDVALLHDGMVLIGRDDAALANGANLAMIGDELIQFGGCLPLGGGRYRLSQLWRGRRGTEAAANGHAAGEPFVLIEAASLLPIELPAGAVGGQIRVVGSGVGDGAAVMAEAVIGARALRPPSPVHLRVDRRPNGDLAIGWTRRSRTGWPWIDGGDAPLGEEAERYRLTLTPSMGTPRMIDLDTPGYLYAAVDRAADGAMAASAISIAVSQLGAAGLSAPASASFAI
ncbi:GTA baseplate fiber-binding domain-containing protein [Sphingomonas sp. KC8]|uniref:GTA baseplate fiber-binding domain-containing protein n=1 Tax=Sphingomonas sp. KC8 TaxID=1030157 RepID=UPI0002489BC5|nr:phage tail protein [Sphingomonas sp. KC8]ARS29126.1 hypothetical protein KC8_17790 [Sphingomonas sp. KC8]